MWLMPAEELGRTGREQLSLREGKYNQAQHKLKEKLRASVSIKMLRQDLDRRPDVKWNNPTLFCTSCILLFIGRHFWHVLIAPIFTSISIRSW